MKKIAAWLVAMALLCSPTAAEDLSGLYKWADDIVSATGHSDSQPTLTIHVKDSWDDENIPHAYRLWLPPYIACTRPMGVTKLEGVNVAVKIWGIESRVPRFSASAWVPFEACAKVMENIRENIDHSKK